MLSRRQLQGFVSWRVSECEPLSLFLPSDISIKTRIEIPVFFDGAQRCLYCVRVTITNPQIPVVLELQYGSQVAANINLKAAIAPNSFTFREDDRLGLSFIAEFRPEDAYIVKPASIEARSRFLLTQSRYHYDQAIRRRVLSNHVKGYFIILAKARAYYVHAIIGWILSGYSNAADHQTAKNQEAKRVHVWQR
jgi:hypothetical protein